MYLKLKAPCSLTKCFIVIGLIRFLLSSWRCYRRLEAVVSNQSSRAQTLSRWDQLTVIWFQNTLPEKPPGRGWPPHCEPGAAGPCGQALHFRCSTCRFCLPQLLGGFQMFLLCINSKLLSNSKYFFLVSTGLCCPNH